MKVLRGDWFLRGWPDDEYKHWLFKAFEKYSLQQFSENKVYPVLQSVKEQLSTIDWWQSRHQSYKLLEYDIERISLQSKAIVQSNKWINKDFLMEHYEKWTQRIKPLLLELNDKAKSILDDLKSTSHIKYPLIESAYDQEGWIIITDNNQKNYYFKYSGFILPKDIDQSYKLHTSLMGIFPKQYNPIQKGLFGKRYVNQIKIQSSSEYPIAPTVLPFGKRIIYKKLTGNR